jgi:uncharacterized protein (DUF885 family)
MGPLGVTELSALESRLAASGSLSGRQRLAAAGATCERLRELVVRQALVSLPTVELRVAEKVSCVRPGLGEISYLPPAPGGPAELLLAPLPEGERETPLELLNRCLDTGWLGLHLLAANAARSSLTRRLNPSPQFLEGWGLYMRNLLVSSGWLEGPEEAAALLLHNRAQLQRALLDMDLHVTGLSYEDALQRVQALPRMNRERAHFALTRLCREPSDALAGAVGGCLLEALQRGRSETDGASQLGPFHDRLLSAGPVALPLVVRRVFGEPAWQALEREFVS